ncbi:hypothetical protein V9T40_007707 [Parthenolecanium corni]|uniref:Mismatch repair endonuclease PMS2 n=1 Tax=Parthenolecanium corni TaxID=536013 RepID=A0AAN9TVT0_9HEMI
MSNSAIIMPIGGEAVHKICSGQVVLSLAVALKELLENSLDAGASAVDIRLREYGSELIEVVDNGIGIHPNNFEALALKHYTSKLRDFSELEGIATFGFRGEALSSLCAVGQLVVVTRHESEPCGSKLIFDKMGVLQERVPCPRQVGTTVTLTNLFSSLPVRQKEFHRNLKREFSKATHLLSSYCLISTNVKISCVNQTKKGRTTFLCTQNNSTIRENISCVFGPKQLSTLLEIVMTEPSQDILEEFKIENQYENIFRLEGYISSCEHGSGRSSADRQFIFINSRPCDLSKIIKLTNEIYHRYNAHQYPFVLLNILLPKQSVDVNVTPDKRLIFFEHEKSLLATLKCSLTKIFENIPSTYRMNTLISDFSIKTSKMENLVSSGDPSVHGCLTSSQKLSYRKRCTEEHSGCPSSKQMKSEVWSGSNEIVVTRTKRHEVQSFKDDSEETCFITETKSEVWSGSNEIVVTRTKPHETQNFEDDFEDKFFIKEMKSEVSSSSNEFVVTRTKPHEMQNFKDDFEEKSEKCVLAKCFSEFSDTKLNIVKESLMNTSLDQIAAALRARKRADSELIVNKFHADIAPDKNEIAEEELKKEISKDMFRKMKIIGQFNFGFIITKLENDLFIVDQHATDEKYNFETLQQTTTLNSQKLVVPQELNLTSTNECVLRDNLDVLRKNGFEFSIDDSAEVTKKVKLTSIPVSYNWQFGKEDVDEMLFMLQDAPHTVCRPTRLRSMFASRACRKSVMIGTPLSVTHMRKLINNMGCIEQPWNCPHGRPTMRHLINLSILK